jgi:hypothetical protein
MLRIAAGKGKRTGTVVVSLEEGKHGANGKDVGILGEHHFGGVCVEEDEVSLPGYTGVLL